MVLCSYCSDETNMPFRCKFCDNPFCATHHLPENHECMNLSKLKTPALRKWIYMPDYKPKKSKKPKKKKKFDYVKWVKRENFLKFLEEKFPKNTILIKMYNDNVSTKNIAKYAGKTEEEFIEDFRKWHKETFGWTI
jgi:predicted nucleic acid binding AN1-type Zn finger protein